MRPSAAATIRMASPGSAHGDAITATGVPALGASARPAGSKPASSVKAPATISSRVIFRLANTQMLIGKEWLTNGYIDTWRRRAGRGIDWLARVDCYQFVCN